MARKIEMPKVTKDKKSTKGRELVYQGNPLIQSRKHFSTIGTRLFILSLMTLNPHLSKKDKHFDSEFPDVHISTGELTKLFGDSKYLSMLKSECEKLFNSSITLDYKNGWELMHIFDVMKYVQNDGLYIRFDSKMKEYLLELVEGGYTALNIEQIFKLSSTYAVRLIELCMQYRNMTKGNVITRSLTEKEIRFYLNVPDDAYAGRLDNFKRFVLDEPILEIAEKTDFRMSYHVEKEGRKIKNFVFELDTSQIPEETFSLKVDDKKLPVSAPYSDVQGELINQGFTAKAAKEILSEVKNNVEVGLRLQYALKVLPEYEKKSSVKNKQGFLRKAILENWRRQNLNSKKEMNISAASKDKVQMELNNLDAEKEKLQQQIDFANDAMKKTGITAADLQGEEKPIPLKTMEMIQQEILKGNENEQGVQILLNAFNFGVERFKQVYMSNYQDSPENAFTWRLGANAKGFSSLGNVFANYNF